MGYSLTALDRFRHCCESWTALSHRITILGDGQMGLVLAEHLACAGYSIRLWSAFPDAAAALAQSRSSQRMPTVTLPDAVDVTSEDAAIGEDADMLINAVPTQFIRSVWTRLADHTPDDLPIVCVSKGIETGTLRSPTGVLHDVLDEDGGRQRRPICVLSGPTIAAELARHQPATMIAASDDADLACRVQSLFTMPWLRVYTGDDPIGVEIAGAAKNVIALAAGMVDGLELGNNAKSALLARGLAEIARLGVALGARTDTFFGIAGVGDLATTCFSPEGRNRNCGEAIGRGRTLKDALAATTSVVEGVETTRAIVTLASRHEVDMPIAQAVHAILFDGLSPRDAIGTLMQREAKAERIG